jgi:hypothetical protein
MVETKYNTNHHAGANADARIKHRLQPSNDTANADSVTTTGHSPTRTVTSVHLSGSAKQHGSGHPGEGDVFGRKRTTV